MRLVLFFGVALFTVGCGGGPSKTDDALNKGDTALKAKQFDVAVNHFNEAIERDPDSAAGYRGRGRANFERDHLKSALKDCETALQLDPNDAAMLVVRGRILLKQKKTDAALADLSKAIELQPDQVEGRTWRASIFLDRDEYAKAIEDCDLAIKGDNGRYERKRFAQAYLFRALALFHTGEHSRAENDATLASALDADFQGRDVPCLRRGSVKFTFRDPAGGVTANVKLVAKIDAKTTARQRIVFRDMKKVVQAVRYSPDGRYLAYGGNDGLVRIRAAGKLSVLAGLKVSGYAIFDLAFSPDGRYLAAALVGPRMDRIGRNQADQTRIRIWQTDGWRLHRDLPGRYTFVDDLTFSPDSRHLAAAYSYYRTSTRRVNEVSLWNVTNGVERKRMNPGEGFINSLAFAPDDRLIIGRGLLTDDVSKVVTKGGAAEVWNPYTASKITTFEEKSGAVSAIAFLDGGRKLVTGSRGGLVKVWDMKTKKVLLNEATHMSWVSSLAVSPDGRRIASGGQNTIYLLDAQSGEMVTLFGNPSSKAGVPTHSDVVEMVAFSHDGRFIASASRDKTVRIWNASISEAPPLPELHTYKRFKYPGILKQAIFSPNGKIIALGGTARDIILLSVEDGRMLGTLKGHVSEVYDLSFSPDGSRLASASGGHWDPDKKGEIKIWNVAQRKLLTDLEGFEGPVVNVDFSPDGRYLVSCHWDQTSDVRVWDTNDWRTLGVFRGHQTVHGAVFSRDGKSLATIGWLHIRTWNVPERGDWSKQQKRSAEVSYPGVCGVDFSPDGKTLALTCQSAGEPTVVLVDRKTNSVRTKVQGARCLYSPNGRWLATQFIDRIHLYDQNKDNQLAYVLRSTRKVDLDRFSFSPDGTKLLAGCADGTIVAWDLSSAK